MSRAHFGLNLALGSLLSACAAASFQPHFEAPPSPTQPVVVSELLRPKPRVERPVVVGLTTDPMRLFAWDLEHDKLLWERDVRASSAPLVAADAVIIQESGAIVVRDLQSGAERVRLDEDAALVGADGEGTKLVISLAYTDKVTPGAVIFIEGDQARWKQKLNLPVGVPAVAGEYISVPWATQRLSILATSNGRELARLHFKNNVLGHALVEHGRLYVGQIGLAPLTTELFEHPQIKHEAYAPYKRTLPAQPPILRDGYAAVPDPDNAQHRLQLTWRIAEGHGDAQRSENDLALLRFYRLLFGLDANSDQVRWVRNFEHDLVAASTVPGALLVADTAGTVRVLDVQGKTRAQVALGRKLRMATLRPGTWRPTAASAADGPGIEPQPADLRGQLTEALVLPDDRLVAARAYAVSQIARDPDPEITTQLITICAERREPDQLRAAACSELRERTTGDVAVLAMLRMRASFLEGKEAPPVGPLAQAAAKMLLKPAGPLLAAHIEDPSTPVRDLSAVFDAVETLKDPSAAAGIERFVRLHHAEPEGSDLLPALGSALRVLGALRIPSQRAILVDVANDGLTPKPTRDAARAALNVFDAPEPQPAAPVVTPVEVQDTRPYALTAEIVSGALSGVREPLEQCLLADPAKPRSGRANIVVDAAGAVEGVFVLPASLQACAEPVVRGAKFPSTRLGRQRITHVFSEPKPKPEADKR